MSGVFVDPTTAAVGDLKNHVNLLEFAKGSVEKLGGHSKPVRALSYNTTHSVLVSGSWDNTVKTWDVRSRSDTNTLTQPGKVYSMDSVGNRVIVATSGLQVLLPFHHTVSLTSR